MTDPIVPNLTPEERQQVISEGRRRVRNRQRAGIAAGSLVLLSVLVPVAFMLGSGHDDSEPVRVGGHGTSTSAAPSTSSSSTEVSTTVSPSTSSLSGPATTAPPTTAVPEVPTVKTIVPDAATEAALRQAYIDYKGMQSDEIEPEPGSNVYVAQVAAVNTSWATATYTATAATTYQHGVNMQDGGNQGIFTRWGDGPWRMISNGNFPCGAWGVVPDDVQRAWGIPAPTMTGCDRKVPPAGAAGLMVDADYYLVPAGWTVTPVQNHGGPASFGTMVGPNGQGRIDMEVNGGSNGAGGFHNPDGTPNLDSPSAKAMVGCTPTSWIHLDTSTVSFTCAATVSGLDVSGIVQIGPGKGLAESLTVTMPPAAHDLAAIILDFRRRSPVGLDTDGG